MDILKKIINMYAEPVSRIISIRISNIQKKIEVVFHVSSLYQTEVLKESVIKFKIKF